MHRPADASTSLGFSMVAPLLVVTADLLRYLSFLIGKRLSMVGIARLKSMNAKKCVANISCKRMRFAPFSAAAWTTRSAVARFPPCPNYMSSELQRVVCRIPASNVSSHSPEEAVGTRNAGRWLTVHPSER
jgi:hypothetical protein